MRVLVAIASDPEAVPVVALVSSSVPIVVGRSRSDVVTVLSDRDVKAASLDTGADALTDGTARRVVVVTSCVVEVERRAEVSIYMLKILWKKPVFLVTTYQSF